MNDESFAWDSADERAICREHNEALAEPLQALLERCFAVYQAQPLAVATPVVLVGQKVIEGWKR